jgi:hypothetical protein
MPTKMLRPEDLQSMTGSALIAHYNQLVEENPELGYKKTERFASAAKGIYRIEALYSSIKGAAADDGRTHQFTDTETSTQAVPETSTEPSSTDTPQASEEETDMAKKTKTARKPRTTAKSTGSAARGFAPEAKIKIMVDENPRRGAAAERFKLYKDGMTVATYCSKFEGGRSEALVHLRWDAKHGFIKVA